MVWCVLFGCIGGLMMWWFGVCGLRVCGSLIRWWVESVCGSLACWCGRFGAVWMF